MTTGPGPQVCPLCALPDYLTWEVEAPGLWRYTCGNPQCGGYSWPTTGRDPLKTGSYDGIAADLGIKEDLLDVIGRESRWLEYGVVEYLYAVENPTHYRQLVQMFSHTAIERPIQNSASAFIGTCLGILEQEGRLAKRTCRATGYWSYNTTVTAWAPRGNSLDAPIRAWAEFAIRQGLNPEEWTLAGPPKNSA